MQSKSKPAECKHCQNGWLGGENECVNGVFIDIDEAHEGPLDVIYPIAPCHPKYAAQQRGDDFENDSIERLSQWRGITLTKEPTP